MMPEMIDEMIDEKIQKYLLNKDNKLLGEILESQRKPILKSLSRYCHDTNELLDVLQESYLQIIRGLPTYDSNKGSFTTWSVRISLHTIFKHMKKKKSQRFVALEDNQIAEDGNLNERKNISGFQLLQTLPWKYRIPISLKYLNEYSISEIASILKIKEKKVNNLIFRGLEQLRLKYRNVLIGVSIISILEKQAQASQQLMEEVMPLSNELEWQAISSMKFEHFFNQRVLMLSGVLMALILFIAFWFNSKNFEVDVVKIETKNMPYEIVSHIKQFTDHTFSVDQEVTIKWSLHYPSGKRVFFQGKEFFASCHETGDYQLDLEYPDSQLAETTKANISKKFRVLNNFDDNVLRFSNKNSFVNFGKVKVVSSFDEIIPFIKQGKRVLLESGTIWEVRRPISIGAMQTYIGCFGEGAAPVLKTYVSRVLRLELPKVNEICIDGLVFENHLSDKGRLLTFSKIQQIEAFKMYRTQVLNYWEGGCYFLGEDQIEKDQLIFISGCKFRNCGGRGAIVSSDQRLLLANSIFEKDTEKGSLISLRYPNGSIIFANHFISSERLNTCVQVSVGNSSHRKGGLKENESAMSFYLLNNTFDIQCDYIFDFISIYQVPLRGYLLGNHIQANGLTAKVMQTKNVHLDFALNQFDLLNAYHEDFRIDFNGEFTFNQNDFHLNELSKELAEVISDKIVKQNNSNRLLIKEQ